MQPYRILYPGGNTTAIVTVTVPSVDQIKITQKIMAIHTEVEQVGFLSPAASNNYDCQLDMMGGEFCINAARCAALIWSQQTGSNTIFLKVSGFDEVIKAIIRHSEVKVLLPTSLFLNSKKIKEGTIVNLLGIRLLVTDQVIDSQLFNNLLHRYGLDCLAFGLIQVTYRSENNLAIKPLIWVKATNSLIRETGCGSGSLASCLVAYEKNNKIKDFTVLQPSGDYYKIIFEFSETSNFFSIQGIVIEKESKNIHLYV